MGNLAVSKFYQWELVWRYLIPLAQVKLQQKSNKINKFKIRHYFVFLFPTSPEHSTPAGSWFALAKARQIFIVSLFLCFYLVLPVSLCFLCYGVSVVFADSTAPNNCKYRSTFYSVMSYIKAVTRSSYTFFHPKRLHPDVTM